MTQLRNVDPTPPAPAAKSRPAPAHRWSKHDFEP